MPIKYEPQLNCVVIQLGRGDVSVKRTQYNDLIFEHPGAPSVAVRFGNAKKAIELLEFVLKDISERMSK